MKFNYKYMILPLLLIGAMFIAGCGIKAWPTPSSGEDIFTIKSVTSERTGECLKVTVVIDGEYKNVDNLSLQYQADGDGPGEGCPTCPFFPAIRKQYTPGSEGITSDGSTFIINQCGFNPLKSYRFRVVGRNVHDSVGMAISDVYSALP